MQFTLSDADLVGLREEGIFFLSPVSLQWRQIPFDIVGFTRIAVHPNDANYFLCSNGQVICVLHLTKYSASTLAFLPTDAPLRFFDWIPGESELSFFSISARRDMLIYKETCLISKIQLVVDAESVCATPTDVLFSSGEQLFFFNVKTSETTSRSFFDRVIDVCYRKPFVFVRTSGKVHVLCPPEAQSEITVEAPGIHSAFVRDLELTVGIGPAAYRFPLVFPSAHLVQLGAVPDLFRGIEHSLHGDSILVLWSDSLLLLSGYARQQALPPPPSLLQVVPLPTAAPSESGFDRRLTHAWIEFPLVEPFDPKERMIESFIRQECANFRETSSTGPCRVKSFDSKTVTCVLNNELECTFTLNPFSMRSQSFAMDPALVVAPLADSAQTPEIRKELSMLLLRTAELAVLLTGLAVSAVVANLPQKHLRSSRKPEPRECTIHRFPCPSWSVEGSLYVGSLFYPVGPGQTDAPPPPCVPRRSSCEDPIAEAMARLTSSVSSHSSFSPSLPALPALFAPLRRIYDEVTMPPIEYWFQLLEFLESSRWQPSIWLHFPLAVPYLWSLVQANLRSGRVLANGVLAAMVVLILQRHPELPLSEERRTICGQLMGLAEEFLARQRAFSRKELIGQFNPLSSWPPPSLRPLVCVLCRTPVAGLSVKCSLCGHGGHLKHFLSWKGGCPVCGCSCQLGTKLRSPFYRSES